MASALLPTLLTMARSLLLQGPQGSWTMSSSFLPQYLWPPLPGMLAHGSLGSRLLLPNLSLNIAPRWGLFFKHFMEVWYTEGKQMCHKLVFTRLSAFSQMEHTRDVTTIPICSLNAPSRDDHLHGTSNIILAGTLTKTSADMASWISPSRWNWLSQFPWHFSLLASYLSPLCHLLGLRLHVYFLLTLLLSVSPTGP